MNRKWLLLGGLALVLVLGVYLVDHVRAARTLGAAYTVRDAGERCFSELASGFSGSGISGVSAATENAEFAIWARMSKSAAEATRTPVFFCKDRVLAMSIAAKQYDELIRTPRGTWLTLTHEIGDKRSRLDAAIIAVETEDVPSATKETLRAESQREVVRTAKGIADAKEKAVDTANEAAREAQDTEYKAALEAQENTIPATAAERYALVAERCRKAGRPDCGPAGSEKADAEIVANWRIRSGLAPAPTPTGGAR